MTDKEFSKALSELVDSALKSIAAGKIIGELEMEKCRVLGNLILDLADKKQ